jgi:hypothetical protein
MSLTELAGKILGGDIARAREAIDDAALPACDLSDDMTGRAEAVDAEPLSTTCHYQRSPPDQTGAQQGCD